MSYNMKLMNSDLGKGACGGHRRRLRLKNTNSHGYLIKNLRIRARAFLFPMVSTWWGHFKPGYVPAPQVARVQQAHR